MFRAVRVYVAGPITKGDRKQNIHNAIDAADRLLVAGHIPFVPHLCHWWNKRHRHDYEYWLNWDFEWLRQCEALVRIPGESAGADREVEFARGHHITVHIGTMDRDAVDEFLFSWANRG